MCRRERTVQGAVSVAVLPVINQGFMLVWRSTAPLQLRLVAYTVGFRNA